ncbi:MAG: NAD-dependent epimerase/dehydratase family protein [Candidatus Omnitrophica bacterium]|nr:NAD-dependent epimerase/dehydratase family protein [Candidatus Omnitrophota bacterium]
MKTVLVTGGAGFIGSHIAEFFARQDWRVIVLDNLSRTLLLKSSHIDASYNWDYLHEYYAGRVQCIKGDVNDHELLRNILSQCDAIIHTAGQTAVTRSIEFPREDFTNNAAATFTLLEESRLSGKNHRIIFCSTNKVYGEKANFLPIIEKDTRYIFGAGYEAGIDEEFGIDLCKHSPYGCSKAAADIYCQEYARHYGMNIGIFRMSCIYGPRQLGLEDQGWIAWFIIAMLMGQKITICGDGKQVRDILYVDDLVRLMYDFIISDISYGLYNVGGGCENAVSILEVISLLEDECKLKANITCKDWRASDQKVFYTNIEHVKAMLGWTPMVSCKDGIRQLVQWYKDNRAFLKRYNGIYTAREQSQ